MNELTLDELKQIEFDILKHFDAFCKEHNIRYFLAYGTLLGAIRYKKFIPWDDDVDVLVPREDYERLLNIYEDNAQYKLFAFEKDGKFHCPYTKLCDLSTKKVMPGYRNSDAILGVEIDIFPLDCWHSDYEKAQKEARSISRDILFLEASELKASPMKKGMKSLLWRLVSVYAKIRTDKYFNKKIVKKSKANKQDQPAFVGSKSWCIYGERGIIPAEAFAEVTYVEFEGEMFPAPKGYDTYLTCLYGDYLPEPPKEKQKSNHSFKAYRI